MADDRVVVLGKTDAGKEIGARPAKGSLLEICFKTGGEVPACLKGLFTSEGAAKAAIDDYLANYQKPSKTKGK